MIKCAERDDERDETDKGRGGGDQTLGGMKG